MTGKVRDFTESSHPSVAEETQSGVEAAVARFAEDFGFDLDEEGHPIEDGGDEPRLPTRPESESEEAGSGPEAEKKEEEAVPA